MARKLQKDASQDIKKYYDELAEDYDDNRFNNSYGKYIHAQEHAVISKWFKRKTRQKTIDLACGTGRFLEFAATGADISERILLVARKKYPQNEFINADAATLPLPRQSFQNALSMHLMMHLNEAKLLSIVAEVSRILAPNGSFLWDIPSKKRRNLTKRPSQGWHGNFSLSIQEIKTLLGDTWMIDTITGIAFFPVHRIPKKLRPLFVKIDSWLCRSPFKEYASYLIIEMRKK